MIRRQHHIDMCNGPLWNKILLFALPLICLLYTSDAADEL